MLVVPNRPRANNNNGKVGCDAAEYIQRLKLQSGIGITKLSKWFVTDLKSLTLHNNVKN